MGLLSLACCYPRQRPIDIINILRKKLTPMFAKRVEELNIEHVTCVRDWDSELPNAVKLYGAYRRRKRDVDDGKIIPHSFTFVRRESCLFRIQNLSCPCDPSWGSEIMPGRFFNSQRLQTRKLATVLLAQVYRIEFLVVLARTFRGGIHLTNPMSSPS